MVGLSGIRNEDELAHAEYQRAQSAQVVNPRHKHTVSRFNPSQNTQRLLLVRLLLVRLLLVRLLVALAKNTTSLVLPTVTVRKIRAQGGT